MKKIAIFLMCAFSMSSHGACGIKTLKGSYMVAGNYTGYNNDTPVSCGIMGRMVFNGIGGVDVYEMESCAGIFLNNGGVSHDVGQYTINALCTGTVSFNGGTNMAFIFDKAMKNGQIIGGNPTTGLSGSGAIIKQ